MHRPIPRRTATSGTVYVSAPGRSFSEIGSSGSKRATSSGMTLVFTSRIPFWCPTESLAIASGRVAGGLSSFACSGGGGEGEGGVSAGEVADPGEFPVRDNEGGDFIEQLPDVFGGLALPEVAPFTPDGAEGGGVATALGREVPATPRRR